MSTPSLAASKPLGCTWRKCRKETGNERDGEKEKGEGTGNRGRVGGMEELKSGIDARAAYSNMPHLMHHASY